VANKNGRQPDPRKTWDLGWVGIPKLQEVSTQTQPNNHQSFNSKVPKILKILSKKNRL
jgi:hypothetical protein